MSSRSLSWFLASCVLIGLVDSVAKAQPATPAPPPAPAAPAPTNTVPATTQAAIVPTDQKSPRGALKLLMTSMNKGDFESAKSVFAPSNDVETKMVNAIVGQQQAMLKYRDAAVTAFGAEEARKLVGDIATEEARGLSMIDAATEQINGDSATVTDGQQQITLKKQGGKWTFPIVSFAPEITAATIDNVVTSIGEQKKVLSDLTDELSKGKYKTVEEAGRALQMKMMQQAMSHDAAATKPATGPATAPAPVPAPAPPVGPQ